MEHRRRKRLIRATHELYLDNFKNSESWDAVMVDKMSRYMERLKGAPGWQAQFSDADIPAGIPVVRQLELFA